jgi:hypothetical protein
VLRTTGLGRLVVASVLAALLLVACARGGPTAASPTPTSGPRTEPTASDPAADLRVNLDLLLGQHVLLLARTSDAVLASRTAEFDGYGEMVHLSAESIGDAVAQHADESGASQALAQDQEAWDEAYLDYVSAAFGQTASAKSSALTGLESAADQYATGLASATGVPVAQLTPLLGAQVQDMTAMVDAQVAAGTWTAAYQTLQTAYAQAQSIGDVLAAGLAHRGHVQGSQDNRAVDLRLAVDLQLQEQVGLGGFAASASLGGRSAELEAAEAAQQSSLTALQGSLSSAPPGTANAIGLALNGLFGDFMNDVAAVGAQNQTAQELAEARLISTFPAAFAKATSYLHLSSSQSLGLSNGLGQAMIELAQTEGAGNYESAPFSQRTAFAAATSLGDGLTAALIHSSPASFE